MHFLEIKSILIEKNGENVLLLGRNLNRISVMGLYVHIPFCRNKCFYCGFYSVASLQLKEAYLKALLLEMEIRKEEGWQEPFETLYFGGGTPSYLENEELERLLNHIQKQWSLSPALEASIEVNPEDVTKEKLQALRQMGFNRLTIGVQSFDDAVLRRIHRNHTAQEAKDAIEMAQTCGFENLGIDLIIGLPGSNQWQLEQELKYVNSLGIDHVSVYILSLDSNSVFEKLSEKGKFHPLAEDELIRQYLYASDCLKESGYEHYEISNFAKNFKYSRHNLSYWQQKPYLGLGAAAHSYDLVSRQWNISHLKRYINGLNNGVLEFEKEVLTQENKFNEYLMTNLRTMWGIDLNYLKHYFFTAWPLLSRKLEQYEFSGWAKREGERWRLTEQAWLVSDSILGELFV